jgi:Druantia protein DruA/Transposase Tn5 dimerisation domain/Transposase DNA-binding
VRICGQNFGTGIIERIRGVIRGQPEISRSALSRRVCEWLDWRSLSGKPKEVSSRKALLELERRGLIELPAPRQAPGRLAGARESNGCVEAVASFRGELPALGRVQLVAVDSGVRALSALWRRLMDDYHPLGAGPLCGAQQRYLIRSEATGWLGGFAFSAAAWQLQARDEWIGWCAKARVQNLPKVVANSRFLLLPTIEVPNLASHLLGLAARQVVQDWPARYGVTPVLLESFVDERRHTGTCYRAANWQRLGETAGRGRQDAENRCAVGCKGIYVLPVHPAWRKALCAPPEARFQLPQGHAPVDWAEQEFARVPWSDGRLRTRLCEVAADFYAQPLAPIPQACHGNPAKTRAAYRLFANPQVDLASLIKPHIEATAERIGQHPVVLAVQDTTSLNYSAHPATEGLGPINTRADAAQGLKLHDTVAFTAQGVPLGVLDAQCWARDPQQAGKRAQRKALPIEQKESAKWLRSFQRVAAIQTLCPNTRLVSVGDREADIYELFASHTPEGPDLLVRADRGRQRQVVEQQPLWDWMPAQPVAGHLALHIPGKGGRKARTAELEIRYARVELKAPKAHRGAPIGLWAVYALESHPPARTEAVEWLLLTTVAVEDFAQACERLQWYAIRWCIEVYHRTLKSGCRIEDRRLGDAQSLQACLGVDMVVAWRVYHLAKLGRETPEVPCTVFFREEEWKALCIHHQRTPEPPKEPPTLNIAMRMVAKLGGFLGRKADGPPGTTTLWRGLQRLSDITDTFVIMRSAMPAGP